MGIPILEKEGYEADDILGTVSAKCEREGREIVLVTGDRDSFQLSGEKTTILYTKRGISDTVRVTPEYICETYGSKPIQMIDVKGLMGDASDNIPGVPGVGEKTALKLIQQYGSLENVLNTAETEQKGKLRERLIEHRDLAELSKHLATIDRAVPIEIDFESWRPDGLGGGVALLKELGMNQAARKLTEKAQAIAPASVPVAREKVALPAIERLDSIRGILRAREGNGENCAVGFGILWDRADRGDGIRAAEPADRRRPFQRGRDRGRGGAGAFAAARSRLPEIAL